MIELENILVIYGIDSNQRISIWGVNRNNGSAAFYDKSLYIFTYYEPCIYFIDKELDNGVWVSDIWDDIDLIDKLESYPKPPPRWNPENLSGLYSNKLSYNYIKILADEAARIKGEPVNLVEPK